MTALRAALTDYLDLRRSLGFSLQRDAKLLAQFLTYLENQHADTITIDHAVAWASLPRSGSPNWWAFRMSVVRGFAIYVHTIDPVAEVPPTGLLPSRPHRAVPYLYSDEDIAALRTAARTLRYPLGVVTYQTLIGLLAVTGLFSGGRPCNAG